jgi:hypothetical protein
VRAEFQQSWQQPIVLNWMMRADLHVAELWGESGWALQRFEPQLQAVADEGDFVGMHAHPIRDASRCEDYADESWTVETMAAGLDAYERHFGHPPGAVSWGRGWTSRALLDLQSERGVAVDMSVFPGRDASVGTRSDFDVTADVPDLSMVPRHPYYPAADDWRREADEPGDGTWILPFTSAPVNGWANPLRRLAHRVAGRKLLGRVEQTFLFAVTEGGFPRFADRLAGVDGAYLTLSVRSSRFLTASVDDTRRCFDALGRVRSVHGTVFTDPVSVVRSHASMTTQP